MEGNIDFAPRDEIMVLLKGKVNESKKSGAASTVNSASGAFVS